MAGVRKQMARRCEGRIALVKSNRGAVLPMMAAGLLVIVGSVGSAIDIGRIYLVRTQMQAGVDAAALAGARSFAVQDGTGGDRDKQVEAYFNSNFRSGFLGLTNLSLTPTGAPARFQTVNSLNLTTVTAQGLLPMTFMGVFGLPDQLITVTAKAELQPRPLEVMVVLDNTGSMKGDLSGGKTRMTALKEAAKSFLSILYQGGNTRRDLALGFVMYDITANVGKLLTDWRPASVAQVPGFHDSTTTAWPTNPLAWKGCVMNDSTVKDVNADVASSEAGAWDIVRTLPGEGSHPAIQPYFVPPIYAPLIGASAVTDADKANPDGDYYKQSSAEAANNLYKINHTLANNETYRKFFYDYYIGLNNGSGSSGDDVITKTDGTYYDPAGGRDGSYTVQYSRLPRLNTTMWKDPTTYVINPLGGRVNDGSKDQTPNPSPNWQCPQPAVKLAYGRTRDFYNDIVDNQNGAIYPANGTMHHAGMIWGYRLLVRDDVFPRANPTNEQARRALVFMTDGVNEIGENLNGYYNRTFTMYGRWSDKSIATDRDKQEEQSVRRFSKTCAALNREPNAPKVYIVALATTQPAAISTFNTCAPGRVYVATTAAQLNSAFKDIAAELVDLHLVQ